MAVEAAAERRRAGVFAAPDHNSRVFRDAATVHLSRLPRGCRSAADVPATRDASSAYRPAARPEPKGDLAELEAFLGGPLPFGRLALRDSRLPDAAAQRPSAERGQRCVPAGGEALLEPAGSEGKRTEMEGARKRRNRRAASSAGRRDRAASTGVSTPAGPSSSCSRGRVGAGLESRKRTRGSRLADTDPLSLSDRGNCNPLVDKCGDIPTPAFVAIHKMLEVGEGDSEADIAEGCTDTRLRAGKKARRLSASPGVTPPQWRALLPIRPPDLKRNGRGGATADTVDALAVTIETAGERHGETAEDDDVLEDVVRTRDAQMSPARSGAEDAANEARPSSKPSSNLSSDLSSVPEDAFSSEWEGPCRSPLNPQESAGITGYGTPGTVSDSGKMVVSELLIESTPRSRSATLRSSAPEPETPLRLSTLIIPESPPEPEVHWEPGAAAEPDVAASEVGSAHKRGLRKPRVRADRNLGDPLFVSDDDTGTPFTRTTRSRSRPTAAAIRGFGARK